MSRLRHLVSPLSVLAGASLLASCAAGGTSRQAIQQIDRMLAAAPGEAQPSKFVAAEIALARAMRDRGAAAALRDSATAGAIIHDDAGARRFDQDDRIDRPVSWRPRSVWTSCDGAMAVAEGRYSGADGRVGDFVTVWQRQRDGDYRWSYRTQALADPQPVKRVVEDMEGQNTVVISALDSIKGTVADCVDETTIVTSAPAIAISAGDRQGRLMSADGTLKIVWSDTANGGRRIVADYRTANG